ncbi:MAG: HAD-IB family phosphatase [Alphaproteobacteria bacterium]|nr:HAD-IB family phosphatase [Alphaproteobacteria bacterium]MDE2340124.1 HAD-IB family phosphatase [Alphaproteobacteria bacterium]
MQRIAIYDMDKTITRRSTGRPLILYALKHHQRWRIILLPLLMIVGVGYALKLLDRKQGKALALRLMFGPHIPEELIPGFVEETLRTNINIAAHAQIARDKAEGYTLVLATASQRIWAQPIADALGFDAVIASENSQRRDGSHAPFLAGENCYGAEKLRRVKVWLAERQIRRDDAYIRFYSDHASDAPCFEFADMAVTVNPHPPLRALAQAKGWPVEAWD